MTDTRDYVNTQWQSIYGAPTLTVIADPEHTIGAPDRPICVETDAHAPAFHIPLTTLHTIYREVPMPTINELRYSGTRIDTAHAHDAGFDLRNPDEIKVIRPGRITTIDTGTAVELPPDYFGLVTLRSSLGKRGLIIPNAPGIIDAGYRGTIRVILTSLTDMVQIEPRDRIAQFVPIHRTHFTAVHYNHLAPAPDGRDTNGFGSSGR